MQLFKPIKSSVIFCGDDVEMLRVAPDGFYVRGVKLDQDEKEARAVYNALVAFLVAHGQM